MSEHDSTCAHSASLLSRRRGEYPAAGSKFNQLTVGDGALFFLPGHAGKYRAHVVCRCDCGRYTAVLISGMKCGNVKSCGCIIPRHVTHGYSDHPLYHAWNAMRARCHRKSTPAFQWYGARGISVCDDWRTRFEGFLEWALSAGWKKGLQIDRIDNEGNYEPSNCRFVTSKENNRNHTKPLRMVTAFGETKPLVDWADDERCTIAKNTLRARLDEGMDPEFAMTSGPKKKVGNQYTNRKPSP